ncbi:MAG: hypothetical protein NT020_06195 [Chloroflexales bacterium]|nr:hypothetical protein [Chloroflexales bacterium]
MLAVSIAFCMLLWLLPIPKTVDVGGFDTPWVSEFYAPQTKNNISYRWSHVPGQIIIMGVGAGDYSLRIDMRSVQTTPVQIRVDGVVVDVVTVSNQFAEYTMPVQLKQRSVDTVMVELHCVQTQIDGTRPVCVAVDRATLIPRAIPIPPLWPLLATVLLLFGMMLLVWEYCNDWRWVVGIIVGLGVIFGLFPLLLLAALPYLLIIFCALLIWRYSATQPPTGYWQAVQLCMMAAIITTVRFAFQGSVGLMLEDEGFLWYGSQRMVAGALPMRDFFGYDLPRYIWNALVMIIIGSKGIYALRLAIALCEWVTLTIVCVLFSPFQVRWRSGVVLLGIVTVLLWLYPRYKIYDHFVIWLMLLVFWWWIVNPTTRRTFWAGIVVGVAAMIGRNHGVYAVCAGSLLMGYVWWSPMRWTQRLRLALIWGVGIVVGFTPMILMMVAVPSFGQGYLEGLRILFGLGKTNLPLPIPWPWRQTNVSTALIGVWFVVPAVTYVVTLGVVCWRRWHNSPISEGVLVAAVVGLVYLQVGYSRADMPHLAQGIAPFIALVVLLKVYIPQRLQFVLMLVLCSGSVSVNWNSALQSTWLSSSTNRQEVTATTQLTVQNAVANQLALIAAIHQKYDPTNESFVVTPYLPGVYALWERLIIKNNSSLW